MTALGPVVIIPPELRALQPHIHTIVKAIQIMLREYNMALSDEMVNLMKNYLNKNHLHFHNERKAFNLIHKLPNEFLGDDLAFTSLIMTLKYFQLYLKKKSLSLDDDDPIFYTQFDIFAAFISASLLANKICYDQLEPWIADVYDIFAVLHKNIIIAMRSIINDLSLNNNVWWSQQRDTHLDFLDCISEYGAMSGDTKLALFSIEDNLPQHLQHEFVLLNRKLFILEKFIVSSSENRLCTTDDEFSFDSCQNAHEHYDLNDYEPPIDYSSASNSDSTSDCSHTSESNTGSYAGSVGVDSRFKFNLSEHESDFLKTLGFEFQLSFTLIDAYQLLDEAEQLVNQPKQHLARFTSKLNAFGEGNSIGNYPDVGLLPIVPPCSPSLLIRFQDALRNNKTIPLRSVSTQVEERANLRSLSY